jgi:hypothetical protein
MDTGNGVATVQGTTATRTTKAAKSPRGTVTRDANLVALTRICALIDGLDAAGQAFVLEYVNNKYIPSA